MIKGEETKSLRITKRMVWNAYQKVKRNGGSAGVDGESLEHFQKNLSKNLYKIQDNYRYMDNELIETLRLSVTPYL